MKLSVTVAAVLEQIHSSAVELRQPVTGEMIFHAMLAMPESQGAEMLRQAGLRFPPTLTSLPFYRWRKN